MSDTPAPAFLPLWTLAVVATASAFVVHLALRSRTMELGYELGRAQQQGARLREVKRVLELEAASYKTPERVEIVARTLLGMEPPSPQRVIPIPGFPPVERAERADVTTGPAGEGPSPAAATDGRRVAARYGEP
jgi:cell division protein FtsL